MEFRIVLFIYLFLFVPIRAEENLLNEWKKFSKSKSSEQLIQYIRCNAYSELHSSVCSFIMPETPPFFGQMGIFITIVNKGRVRGCFGAFRHQYRNLSEVIHEYLNGALRNDPRYPPLEVEELDSSSFILTIADSPIPVVDPDTIALGRFGVFLAKENGQGYVYVPGELKSHSSLKRMIQKENIQDVSVFKAILIR